MQLFSHRFTQMNADRFKYKNCEPDNLSSYKISVTISVDLWLNSYKFII